MSPDGDVVPAAAALRSASVVGLFFGGAWAPSSRKFAPALAEWLRARAIAGGAAAAAAAPVVYCSHDRDQAGWDSSRDALGGGNVFATPLGEAAAVEDAAEALKVDGLPSLLWLDAASGAVLTAEGCEQLAARPRAAWPFGPFGPGAPPPGAAPPPAAALAIAPDAGAWAAFKRAALSRAAGGGVELDAARRAAGRAIAVYSSAHWCGPCRHFTPLLARWYKAHGGGAPGGPEVVFVSCDRSESEFAAYRREHPWLALPFARRDAADAVARALGVQGIPSLVVLDAVTGAVLCRDARARVQTDPDGWPWAAPGGGADAGAGADGCALA